MNLLLSILADDILPIFAIAAVGFLLARHFDTSVKTVSKVSFNALSPCLVFDQLVTSKITGSEFGRIALFCVLLTAAMGLAARLAAVPLRLDRQTVSSFLLVVMFSNSGNYALPVVLFAFGREALAVRERLLRHQRHPRLHVRRVPRRERKAQRTPRADGRPPRTRQSTPSSPPA